MSQNCMIHPLEVGLVQNRRQHERWELRRFCPTAGYLLQEGVMAYKEVMSQLLMRRYLIRITAVGPPLRVYLVT